MSDVKNITVLKKEIRVSILQKRRTLLVSEREITANLIAQKILTLDIFQKSQNIALYHAFAGEVDLNKLWEIACQSGKKIGFPVISSNKNTNSMDFFESSLNEPEQINHFQIKEPQSELSKKMDINLLDCFFIPLVAFDKQGFRLGMGKGYYDRVLSTLKDKKKPHYIGVAYDFQKVDVLPHDSWDIPLDMVVTEKQIYFF